MFRKISRMQMVLAAALCINLALFLVIPILSRVNKEPSRQKYYQAVANLSFLQQEEQEKKALEKKEINVSDKGKKKFCQKEILDFVQKNVPQMKSLDIDKPRFEASISLPTMANLDLQKPVTAAPAKKSNEPKKATRLGYQLGEVDVKPRLLHKIEPVYPYLARRRDIEGRVFLKFLVNKKGEVQRVSVLQAKPEGVFESTALEAVRQWKFKPGKRRGEVVNTWVTVPIRFELEH